MKYRIIKKRINDKNFLYFPQVGIKRWFGLFYEWNVIVAVPSIFSSGDNYIAEFFTCTQKISKLTDGVSLDRARFILESFIRFEKIKRSSFEIEEEF